MARAGIAADEAQAVGEHELRLLRRDAWRPRSCGSSSTPRRPPPRSAARARSPPRCRAPRGERDRGRARRAPASSGVGQAGAVVLGGVARDGERGVDRLLERRAREVRGAGVPAARLRPLAEIHRDAERAVAVVLDGVGLALAHRDREAVALATRRSRSRSRRRAARARAPPARGSRSSAGRQLKPWRFGMARYDNSRWMTKSSAKRNASRKCTSCRRSAWRWSSCRRRSSKDLALDDESARGRARGEAHHEPRGEAPPDAVHRQA